MLKVYYPIGKSHYRIGEASLPEEVRILARRIIKFAEEYWKRKYPANRVTLFVVGSSPYRSLMYEYLKELGFPLLNDEYGKRGFRYKSMGYGKSKIILYRGRNK